jgi:dihydrofolate reductase
MRKLKLQVQMTVDGFIGGPNGEMGWTTFPWTDDINTYVDKLVNSTDTIVLGRKLAKGFIPYWAGVAEHPEYSGGRHFTDSPKVVFTQTLKKSIWPNTVLATDDLVEEITKLNVTESLPSRPIGGKHL